MGAPPLTEGEGGCLRCAAVSARVLWELVFNRPDIIHTSCPGTMVFAVIILAKLLRIPLVVSYHTHIPEYIPRYNLWTGLVRGARSFPPSGRCFPVFCLCTSIDDATGRSAPVDTNRLFADVAPTYDGGRVAGGGMERHAWSEWLKSGGWTRWVVGRGGRWRLCGR